MLPSWTRARMGLVLSCVLFLGSILGCGGGGGGSDTPPATAVAPTISTQPAPIQTVTAGTSVSFTVVATGTPAPTYQWKKGGTAIPTGGTAATYTLASPVVGDTGTYTVTVTNSAGTITSGPSVLNVLPRAAAPSIDLQPAPSTTVVEGASVTFTVGASAPDGGTLSYQWKRGTTSVGTNSASLSLNPVVLADAGNYAVVVTNTLNGTSAQATSNTATLTVNPVSTGPTISVHPQSQTVTAPKGATFSVTATGNNLTYAWKRNGTAISGATQPTFVVPSTDLHAVSDQYSVVVAETGGGSIESQVATLTVAAPKAVYAGDPTVTDTSRAYTTWSSVLTTAPADATGSFRFGYDTGLLNPVWSSTCFFPSAPWTFARPSTYPTDTRITGSLDSSDYSNTGYSRGHMTQFADLRDCYGADAGASSMYMSNMCPQVQALNGAAWGNLETLTAQTLPAAFGRVWVYTGPIFSTQLVAPIGAKQIPVATAFYKILVRETAAGVPKVLALIIPHSTTISSGTTAAVPMTTNDFWKFVTSVDRVQALTGLNFFPTGTTLPAGFTADVNVAGWGNGLEQGPNRPDVHMIKPSWDSTFTHVHNSTGAVTTINTTTAFVGDVVTFEGQAAPNPDPIVSTHWNFGDGTPTSPGQTTSHVYTAAGSYTVTFVAGDSQGHGSSVSRIIYINSSDPTVPVIGTQPAGKTVTEGTSVTFTVVATGNGTLTYQWKKDGSDLVGKTGNALTLGNVTVADAGTYSVVVTNTLNGTSQSATSSDAVLVVNAVVASDLNEGFETGTKGSYAAAPVTLGTGSWTLGDTVIAKSTTNGGSTSDHFNGLQGARMQNAAAGTASGKITMGFDWSYGAQTVSIAIAQYNTDAAAPGTLGLWYSTNGGANWTQVAGTVTPASTSLETYTWTVNVNQPIRIELRRTDTLSKGRICLDDIHIVGYP